MQGNKWVKRLDYVNQLTDLKPEGWMNPIRYVATVPPRNFMAQPGSIFLWKKEFFDGNVQYDVIIYVDINKSNIDPIVRIATAYRNISDADKMFHIKDNSEFDRLKSVLARFYIN